LDRLNRDQIEMQQGFKRENPAITRRLGQPVANAMPSGDYCVFFAC
jgi:hypothetical protein